jgi:hypothetical protein
MYQAALFAMHALVIVFLVGILGSAFVVVISFVEDIGELFSSDKAVEVEDERLSRPR